MRRLPHPHCKVSLIEDDFKKRKAGYRGEQNFLYHLGFLPDNHFHIFFDLRLQIGNQTFQIDTLILTPNLIIICEVKNYSGTLIFEKHSDQLIRIYQNKEEVFPNPIYQIQRQHIQLDRFLKQFNVQSIPIEHFVIIGNSTTQIKTSPDNSRLYETVFHSEKIITKMEELSKIHKRTILKPSNFNRVSQLILSNHKDDNPNIIDTFGIQKKEIIKGVRCSACKNFSMIRAHGTWKCSHCYAYSKDAHKQAILDYLLIVDSHVTNKQCQEFLHVFKPQIVYRLLASMNLPTSGNDGGKTYHLPPPDYFQEAI